MFGLEEELHSKIKLLEEQLSIQKQIDDSLLGQALVYFKDFTHLQLKSFKVIKGDSLNETETKILDRALELCTLYTKVKLQHSKQK